VGNNQEGVLQDEDEDDQGELRSSPPPHLGVRQTIQRHHPVNNILREINKGVTTRSRVANFCVDYSFSFEPFKVEDTLWEPDWVVAMLEELHNFKRNKVWSFVERPKQNVVGTKWVFPNKQDDHGVVTSNKARLVDNGYSQVEGLHFEETFAPVARLESIRIYLPMLLTMISSYIKYVKSVFLNGPIKEEEYVEKPLDFEDKEYHNHVYKLSIRRSMSLSKLLKHGMNGFVIFSPIMVLRLVKLILLSSLESLIRICSFAKFMSMTYHLILLTNLFVMSLIRS
jgi:hypothetical protein